jgi:hypothetical protein
MTDQQDKSGIGFHQNEEPIESFSACCKECGSNNVEIFFYECDNYTDPYALGSAQQQLAVVCNDCDNSYGLDT